MSLYGQVGSEEVQHGFIDVGVIIHQCVDLVNYIIVVLQNERKMYLLFETFILQSRIY